MTQQTLFFRSFGRFIVLFKLLYLVHKRGFLSISPLTVIHLYSISVWVNSGVKDIYFVGLLESKMVKTLKDFSLRVICKEIERNTPHYVEELKELPSEYMKQIFKRLSYIALEKFHDSNLYSDSIDSTIMKGKQKCFSGRSF